MMQSRDLLKRGDFRLHSELSTFGTDVDKVDRCRCEQLEAVSMVSSHVSGDAEAVSEQVVTADTCLLHTVQQLHLWLAETLD